MKADGENVKMRLLAIEIADNILRYVILEKRNKGYSIVKFGKLEIDINFSEPGILHSALLNILGEDKISPEKVFITISNGHAVVHQMVLPKMPSNELKEVLSGEIEKMPLFQKDEFDYIYKDYPIDKNKQRIILGAIKRANVNIILNDIQKAKLNLKSIELAPLNLKEIIQLTNPSITQSTSYSYQSEAFLVAHNNNMYFCVYAENEYKLFYKISSGLKQMARNLSGQEKSAVVANWANELRRVIKSYLLETKHTQISQIWAVWDKEAYPDLDKDLNNNLPVKVKPIDLSAIPNLNLKDDKSLNPIFALALTPAIFYINHLKSTFPFTHFFRNFQVKKYAAQNVPVFMGLILVLGLLVGAVTTGLNAQTKLLKKHSLNTEKDYKVLREKANYLFEMQKEYEEARNNLLLQASYIQDLNRVSWSQVLSIFANELPAELALSKFQFSDTGSVQIQGDTYNMESIAELIRRIDISNIVEKGHFDYLKEKELDKHKFFSFSIFAKLKKEDNESLKP